jgi:hypothetical protein
VGTTTSCGCREALSWAPRPVPWSVPSTRTERLRSRRDLWGLRHPREPLADDPRLLGLGSLAQQFLREGEDRQVTAVIAGAHASRGKGDDCEAL